LAGANADHGDPETLYVSLCRLFRLLPGSHRLRFLQYIKEDAA
jgi:hypothetical protein